jgi:alpha-D-ribose 1-methylphosphonate 5-triphosphate synthase subunit PhnH
MLTPDASQRVFRACLDALARPGTIHALPTDELPDGVPAVALAPLALTDLMAPLAGLGSAVGPARRIATASGARLVEPEQARFALALEDSGELARLPIGSAWSPEFGAMVCQRVAGLRDDHGVALREAQGTTAPVAQGELRLRLTGPGIKDSTVITVAGLGAEFFAARAELTAAFPTGIDLLLIADDGTVTGLPRTTRIEVG